MAIGWLRRRSDPALLHDAIEDVGVDPTPISRQFGDRIAATVWDCTEAHKQKELAPNGCVQNCGIRVKLCDALHNSRCCLADGDRLDASFIAKQLPKYRARVALVQVTQSPSSIDSLNVSKVRSAQLEAIATAPSMFG